MVAQLAGGKTLALDYRETAPAAASRDMFVRNGVAVPELSRQGGLAVAVPGEVAGLALAQRTYGTLPLAVVLEPAIRYARDGFRIEAHLAKEIAAQRAGLAADPGLARTYLRADRSPRSVGELLKQPQLAATLMRIAQAGPEAFYHGAIARQIADSVQAAGGVLTEADLAAYRPRWREPLRRSYQGFEVVSMPPPSSGGGVILAALAILRDDDLTALGHDSATTDHLLAETMKHVFADRANFYGDPDFVDVPLERLLSAQNTAAMRRRISASRTFAPDQYGTQSAVARLADDHGTSHVSVMDNQGNAVACTTTINTGFGALLSAGDTGIVLNNEMDDFSAQAGVANVYGLVGNDANAIAPGKRPLSSMSPTLVLKNGVPVLALGGSGGPLIITGTLQVLLNVLAFGLDATTAVAAPRLHHQWSPPVLLVEPGIPKSTRNVLARTGHAVKEVAAMAAIQAVRRDGEQFEGAADPRKGGAAIGW
jgi:gamma-glutamyltranspeptidase/glutathione hydrolase